MKWTNQRDKGNKPMMHAVSVKLHNSAFEDFRIEATSQKHNSYIHKNIFLLCPSYMKI